MTMKKDLKRRVRERQARTGESYSAARAKVVAAAPAAAGAPAPADAPAPTPAAGMIAVEEVIDLTAHAAPLGIKCRVGVSSRIASRIDAPRALEHIRDALLATEDDPETRTLRAVVLRGELPPLGRPRPHDWLEATRRFVQRVRAGIGGISDHGTMLALHLPATTGATLLVICHVWVHPFGRPDPLPQLMLTTADGQTVGPVALWPLFR
jgi:hypothetical protein